MCATSKFAWLILVQFRLTKKLFYPVGNIAKFNI